MSAAVFILLLVGAVIAGLHAALSGFFLLCILFGAAPARRFLKLGPDPTRHSVEPVRTAVVIPAHNETKMIAATLCSARTALPPETHIVVVADNCTDDTAEIARSAGVDVIERFDDDLRGKGFALSAALSHLANLDEPPQVVMVLDADCVINAPVRHQSVRAFFSECARLNQPLQMVYLLEPPVHAPARERIAAFAFRVRGLVRNSGLQKMGGSCQLGGTGMAFPFDLVTPEMLASGETVEDMRLGLDLAHQGHPPHYSTRLFVSSPTPSTYTGHNTQHLRWEHGHVRMIFAYSLPLLFRGLRSWRTFLMALDLSVPPLCLHLFVAVSVWSAAALLVSFDLAAESAVVSRAVLVTASISLAFLAVGVLVAIWAAGSELLRIGDVARIIQYVLSKPLLYVKLVGERQTAWTRTERE